MSKLRVFEAFAGVGSQRMALRNIGVEHEVVAIAEIDKYALQSYEAIHGDCPNLGDISKLSINEIPDHDLFTYSFPCQDISVAGKQSGLEEGSGTRSSLLWECRRVIEGKKPKYLLLENVKNLVGKKNKPDFDKWLRWLEDQGYTNYWQILNAKDYGIPQNRERVFVISILGDGDYEFPKKQELKLRLKDVLETQVDEKYYLSEEIQKRFIYNQSDDRIKKKLPKGDEIKIVGTTQNSDAMGTNSSSWCHDTEGIIGALAARDYKQPKQILIKNATKQGYLEANEGDGIDLNFPDSETRRGRVQKGMSQTLTTGDHLGVLVRNTCIDDTQGFDGTRYYEGYSPTLRSQRSGLKIIEDDFRIRKLTSLECWKLMGFTIEDYNKAKNDGLSDTQLYKQAGNSIVVNVLEGIFSQLLLK